MFKFFKTNNIIPNTIFSLSNRLSVSHNYTRKHNTLMEQYIGKVMDGKTFKSIFKDYFPCKIIGDNFKSFNYGLGLVFNNEEFISDGDCLGNGLYFTDVRHVGSFRGFCGLKIAVLELLDNEPIYIEGPQCKTNSFVVKHIFYSWDFIEHLEQTDYENLIVLIKENPLWLKYVKNQTDKLCMQAVSKYGDTIKYVKDQTVEICMEAVKNDGLALKYVNNQNPEICKLAIDQNPDALQYVHDQNAEICKYALDKDLRTLSMIRTPCEVIFKHVDDVLKKI